MASSTITIRIDSEEKAAAARVAAHFGLDLSSVTRAFYKQMVREQRIPLSLSDPEPNAASLEAIADGDAFLASGRPGRFADGKSLIEAALV